VLIRPVDQVPKTLLLNTFIPTLSELLAAHNADEPGSAFRLRAAVHAGEVQFDTRGPFGEAVDITCRLLDAPEFKARLRQTMAPLALVVSEYIYRSVIWHGYDGIDDRAFEPLVHLEVGGRPQHGWVLVPAEVRSLIDSSPGRRAITKHLQDAGIPLYSWLFEISEVPSLLGVRVRPATAPANSPEIPTVTEDASIDQLLHRAGAELDEHSTVKSIDPAAVVARILDTIALNRKE